MLKSTNGLSEFDLKSARSVLFIILTGLFLSTLLSCGGTKKRRFEKIVDNTLNENLFKQHHTGLLVIDPTTSDTLINRSAKRYFVPASNVKILSLFTALKLIPEKIPTLQYNTVGDTIYFKGLGNPTTLHPYFKDSTALQFLSSFGTIYMKDTELSEHPWAYGWAWEDFDQEFSVERSSFPLYGNVTTVFSTSDPVVTPPYFKDSIYFTDLPFKRDRNKNLFYLPASFEDTLIIPIRMRAGLSGNLLETAINKSVQRIEELPSDDNQILYGISRDSVLRRMMIESDNFLAEQMLLVASSALSDTLSSQKVIDHILETQLKGKIALPRWVDGSGLSRYNLATPESMVYVLDQMHKEQGEARMLSFFPVGGISGTLKDHFKGASEPYVFAKSGSMGNIYCLSGYLRSNSGKLLIFSFMNNHYRVRSDTLKFEMENILEWIRDNN